MPEFEDFADSRVAVAVVATAAVLSPPGRRLIRRGAVYGTAGVLMARDVLSGFIGGLNRGFRETASKVTRGSGAGESASQTTNDTSLGESEAQA